MNKIRLRKNKKSTGDRKMKLWYVNTLFLWILFAMPALTPVASGKVTLFASSGYGTTMDPLQLYSVNPTTGASTLVGNMEISGYMAGLGYDPENGILYGTNTLNDNLYSINHSIGKAQLIGSLGASLMHGLAYDVSTTTLYGSYGYESGDGLYNIDVSTGSATLIGNMGFFHSDHNNAVFGLAVHPETHVLYGAVSGPTFNWGALIEIDKSTAEGTLIAEWTPHITGLAFHPESNILYGIDNWSSRLYTIDITTGIPTLVGSTGLSNPLGLEFIPEPATIFLLGLGAIRLRSRQAVMMRRKKL
jgi:DNA-binding beta-propeller fold protein YncE